MTLEQLVELENKYNSQSETEETDMNINLVEKQQRHFNNRLMSIFWTKNSELEKKHTIEMIRMVPSYELNFEAFRKDNDALVEAKKKAEDVIMVGDPVKMLEAVEAFSKITVH